MRKNPATFGEDLRQLYVKQIPRSKLAEMSSRDPIWNDIRETIRYFENKGLSKDTTN